MLIVEYVNYIGLIVLEVTFWEETGMEVQHTIFNKETDSEKLAMDIVEFLKKWGMWQDVQIFTGGKCYKDNNGELEIRNEDHPEKFLTGFAGRGCDGKIIYEEYSNPERLLDMTFEGSFYSLLQYDEYNVDLKNVSEEVKKMLVHEADSYQFEIICLVDEFMEGNEFWDPVEYDSCEEWLELNDYDDMSDLILSADDIKNIPSDFTSRNEYEDFWIKMIAAYEQKGWNYFEKNIYEQMNEEDSHFYGGGKIVGCILEEFDDLLKKYSLWYEPGFSWSLTTYRV